MSSITEVELVRVVKNARGSITKVCIKSTDKKSEGVSEVEPQVYKLKFKEFHVLSCVSNYEYHSPTTVAALGAAFFSPMIMLP